MKMRLKHGLSVFAPLLLPVAVAQAQSLATQKIAATQRLVPMDKITVGPDDQYQGVADPAETTVFFTRKTDLAPHLCRQNLKTGDVTDVLPLSADSQDPALSPDGKMLAFTYYRYSASGDICLQAVSGGDETCLKTEAGTRSSPFWKSAREVGFLIRSPQGVKGEDNRILVTHLDTKATQELARGAVWAPAMVPGGKYLFFNEMIPSPEGRSERVLKMKDLEQPRKPARVVRIALPGISGFPSVSPDGRYLYFSHYLNDTNNDTVIDGNDNSAVFRVAIEQIVTTPEARAIFPQQLTSVEGNCSFPRPQGTHLYATCAAGGSLDIYQLPLTGVIPTGWGEKLLWNAHQTSRTYQDRVLILNTLKFATHDPAKAAGLTERLLSDHLLADDLMAARYYAQVLQAEPGADVDAYRLLLLYLDARQKKKQQPSAEISDDFRDEILAGSRSMEKVPSHPRLKLLFKGLLQTFLERPEESVEFLKKAKKAESGTGLSSLERHFVFELGHWAFPRLKSRHPGFDPELQALYREMMAAQELPAEARIYYAFRFLEGLEEVQRKEKLALADRAAWVTQTNRDLPADVAQLLQSESATLKLVQSPDEGSKAKAYSELDQLMSKTRSDYFLRKALYIRAILTFAQAGEFKYLDYVARNWLRYTEQDDTEFAYARAVYAGVTLDRGYDSTGAGQLNFAGNFFYGSLTLTDDMESHLGYVRTMLKKGERATLLERYKTLEERHFTEDNIKYVQALLILMDGRPGPIEVKQLDQAMDRLLSMDQNRDSPVRYLLLGYCELAKLLRTANGDEVDLKLYEAAHHHLMLAYDLGRNSERIQAAALTDLGLLHHRVKNHGQASKFFVKRKDLPFLSAEEKERFVWEYARSLYFIDQPEKAASEIEAFLGEGQASAALLERQAFYLQAAGRHEAAVKAYEALFKNTRIQGDVNLAKTYLSYGFSLFSLHREKEAMSALHRSLESVERLKGRTLAFNPVRIRLAALGLLSRLGSDSERLTALEQREAWLKEGKSLLSDWGSEAIQNQLQQAWLLQKSDLARAVAKLTQALKLAEDVGGSMGYLSVGIYHAMVDLMEFGLAHPQVPFAEQRELLAKLVEKTLHGYDTQKPAAAFLDYQGLKVRILWAAFSKTAQPDWKSSETGRRVREALPREWAALEKLAHTVAVR